MSAANDTSDRESYDVCINSPNLETHFLRADAYIPGVIGIVLLFVVLFVVAGGVLCWQKCHSKKKIKTSEDAIVAGRNMSLTMGVITLTAAYVGGDTLTGVSEYIIDPGYGLVWSMAPFCFGLGILLNGIFFGKKMRDAGYVTMLDPFQKKFGSISTVWIYIFTISQDVTVGAGMFVVLGSSLSGIVGLSYLWGVVISGVACIIFCAIGGLESVSFIDIILLTLMFVGMWLPVPFAMKNSAVSSIIDTSKGPSSWLGQVPKGPHIGFYIDTVLLFSLGTMPDQIYYQCALSQKSGQGVLTMSILAFILNTAFVVPGVLLGAVAASTDWNMTSYKTFGTLPIPPCDYPLAAPIVLRFLTPAAVSVIGLIAIAAACLSTASGCILSSASMFAHNVYKVVRNGCRDNKVNKTPEGELMIVLRTTMVIIGALSVIVATQVKSLIALFPLMQDLTYVIVLPQLIAVVYIPLANTYGSLAGVILGLLLRLLSGEFYINLPAVIQFPWYVKEDNLQLFPYKTSLMLINLLIIVLVSVTMKYMYRSSRIIRTLDAKGFQCFTKTTVNISLNESTANETNPDDDDHHETLQNNQFDNYAFSTFSCKMIVAIDTL